jgi:Uma2 family endonuclease
MATLTLLTDEQFYALPEREGVRLELDEGRLIELPMPGFLHGRVQGRIFRRFEDWVDRTGADYYVSINPDFLLHPHTVRLPDVCLVRKSSYAAMQKVRGALRGSPDLVVEVISPSDTAEDQDRRMDQFFRAGSIAVWFFYPETRHAILHNRSGEVRRLGPGQTIQEPDWLPGLEIPLDEIFAGIEELKK